MGMQNKRFKRLGAVVLTAALVIPSFSGMTALSVKASASTQMSSDKEIVYANIYGAEEREQNFDSNWKFYLGDASGAEKALYDDSKWETVSLPHDYSIEQEPSASLEAESGFYPGGTGWYRKSFTLDESTEGKQVRIDFGGVYMNATVWINGVELGTHPYGYTPFSFDLTDYVNYGEENVITVKVDHQTPSSRWYSGSGIYRSVELTITDPVHVDLYGTKIETPNLEEEMTATLIEFPDVEEEGSFYSTPVYWAAGQGITTGRADGTFDPKGNVTRGEMVTFLWRLAGSPEVSLENLKFTDVGSDSFYAKAIAWAVSEGIATGTSTTTFEPKTNVTRAQVVTFLYRYAKGTESATDKTFKDVPSSKYYYHAVAWAAANEITTGNADGTFGPLELCNRGQAVTFLYRTDALDSKAKSVETQSTKKERTVQMNIDTTVANSSDTAQNVVLVHTVYEKGTTNSIGTVTTEAQSVAAGETAEIEAVFQVTEPKLWGLGEENAHLYTVTTEVKVKDQVVDSYDTEYGFRYVSFDKDTGFTLNGENVKLQGVCMHHDQGSLGSEAHYRALERQVEILQEMGCNSIRITHNPAANEMIEICNEKGILVIDEIFDGWMYAKNGNYNDYAKYFNQAIDTENQILGAEENMVWSEFDLKTTISRGENAPSVIMWSLGNEIQEGSGGGTGYDKQAAILITWAQETDTSKLLTVGSNAVKREESEHIDIANQLTAVGGVSGSNYSNGASYDNLHTKYPDWCLYGSETASSINSRGVYDRLTGGGQTADNQLTSYDHSAVSWGAYASEAWYDVITRDFVAGEYVWTGFDYIGEPTPWNNTGAGSGGELTVPNSSYFGIVDTAGFPKDSYYFYQSQWNDEVTTLHVLPAWNENVVVKADTVPVVVYSDAAAVELFFIDKNGNETSLGKKAFTEKTTPEGYTYQIYEGSDKSSTAHENMYLTWNVKYQDGTIKAVAYDKTGAVIEHTEGRSYVTTTGAEAKLNVTVDRTEITADGKDLAYITVDVTDADGNIVPDADDRIQIEVTGNGTLVGVDNGRQDDHQSYQDDNRKAYNGKMLAIVQSTKESGSFTVTATADGLTSGSVTVTAKDSGKAADVSFNMSKSYYVKAGNKPELPATIETHLPDGTTQNLAVTWNQIAEEDYTKAGSFVVKGLVGNTYTVSVTVNMIDDVAGLLNYSTTIVKGSEVALPDSRPVVLKDGTVTDASFAVTWGQPETEDNGDLKYTGTAEVLGESFNVEAYVRVQEMSYTIGDSISKAANLSEDTEITSDTLNAIKDGSTAIGSNSNGGANPTAWTNYDNSQAGDNKAEIVFAYDTQQRIGEIVIHFFRDGYSAEYPDANTTEIYISEDGVNYTKLAATETIGEANGNVKAYTYSFDPTVATFIKFALTNSTAQKTVKACTGITEIEVKEVVTGGMTVYSDAELASLEVNGVAVEAYDLQQKALYVPEKSDTLKVTAVGKNNAAVTVVNTGKDKLVILAEAEDHSAVTSYVVYLGKEKPLSPDDPSKDVPVSDLTAFADSVYPGTGNEGPAANVLDDNASTHWHTNWNTNEATDVNKRFIGLRLKEVTSISGIRYLPRNGNGAVTTYRVEYRATSDGEWISLKTGEWDRTDTSWKLVTFDEPVDALEVRIVGVHTWADSASDAHMSTAEFRLVAAD